MPRKKAPQDARFPFQVVEQITDQHAEKFTRELFDHWTDRAFPGNGLLSDAIEASGAITYPQSDTDSISPAQKAYRAVDARITDEFERLIRPAAMRAFREAATRVLGTASDHLSDADRHAIRAIFLEPKEFYEVSEVSALLGVPRRRLLERFSDSVAREENGGLIELCEVVLIALGIWSRMEIQEALGDQFAEFFDPLAEAEVATIQMPGFAIAWLTRALPEIESERLSDLYRRPISKDRALQNVIEFEIWESDEPEVRPLARASFGEPVVEAVRSRISEARAAAENTADAIERDRRRPQDSRRPKRQRSA